MQAWPDLAQRLRIGDQYERFEITAMCSAIKLMSQLLCEGRLVRFMVMVALLVGGVALGSASFQRSQPPAPVAGDPVTAGVAAPPIVQEFVTALASNDPDAVRSAVPTDPYKLLTSEMQRWDFATVTSVETLSTYVDDPRSSTAIVLIGRTSGGNPVSINLIVHADAGKIVSFR